MGLGQNMLYKFLKFLIFLSNNKDQMIKCLIPYTCHNDS